MPGGRNSGAVYNMYKVKEIQLLINLTHMLISVVRLLVMRSVYLGSKKIFMRLSCCYYIAQNLGQSRLNSNTKG